VRYLPLHRLHLRLLASSRRPTPPSSYSLRATSLRSSHSCAPHLSPHTILPGARAVRLPASAPRRLALLRLVCPRAFSRHARAHSCFTRTAHRACLLPATSTRASRSFLCHTLCLFCTAPLSILHTISLYPPPHCPHPTPGMPCTKEVGPACLQHNSFLNHQPPGRFAHHTPFLLPVQTVVLQHLLLPPMGGAGGHSIPSSPLQMATPAGITSPHPAPLPRGVYSHIQTTTVACRFVPYPAAFSHVL